MENVLTSAALFAIISILFIPVAAYAARPLSTDDAGVVDKGHIEIEGGFEYVNQTDKENSLSFVLRYGLIENLDFGIEIPYKFIDFGQSGDVNGMGDVTITTKYHFLNETLNLPALALSFTNKTKTGAKDKGLGSGERDYSLNGIITKEINQFVVHLNIGYTFVGDPESENLDDIFSYSAALECSIADRLNLVWEIIGETAVDGNFDDNLYGTLAGVNYTVCEALCCDFGIGFEISEASPDYSVITGLTFGF